MVRAPLVRAASAWIAAAVIVAGGLAFATRPATGATTCTRYASPTGSDAAAGTENAPFRTVQKLADSLSSGQTGCLQGGATFGGVRVNRSGITLTSTPGGEKAIVLGKVSVPDSANDVIIENLYLNGRTSGSRVSPSIEGDRVVLRGNDITNDNTAICLHIGSNAGYGIAYDVVIDSNRIFRCGRLPATGFDHGIYVNHAYRTRITNNLIYDNADYGVHLYPGAQDTYVAHNIIDGNGRGVTFSGEGGLVSSGNVVERNIISNSRIRHNVESWWADEVGVGNRADRNCLWNGKMGNVAAQVGFTASDNTVADPRFVDRLRGDFTLAAGSPCLDAAPQTGLVPAPPPALPAPPPSTGTPPAARTPSDPPASPAPPGPRKRPVSPGTTPESPGSAPAAAPRPRLGARTPATSRQLSANRRLVLRLAVRIGRLERRGIGRSRRLVPAALRAGHPRSREAGMRLARRSALVSLRRVTALLNRLTSSKRPLPAMKVPRRVRPTVRELRITNRIARSAVRRATVVHRLLARRR